MSDTLVLTDNEKLIADSLVTILQFAKQYLPEGKSTAITDYALAKVGELADEDKVEVPALITALGSLATAICGEAHADNVKELMSDITDAATAGEQGKIGVLIGKFFEIIHDVQTIKKQGK